MHRKIFPTFLLVLLITFTLTNLIPPRPVQAATASDLLAAVQALRASKGLPPLIVNAALMASAQGHSDYQASIGHFTHTGAGGSTPVSRAMAAGFGGGATVYISENVAFGNTLVGLDQIIYTVWADPDHWKTMTSSLYINAGAGVTTKNGAVYYTLDTGYLASEQVWPTSTLAPGAPTRTLQAPRTPVPTVPLIAPIKTSTPNPDGSIVHPVGYGQAMLSISGAYGLKLDDLRRLNNMTASSPLWAGQKLLIRAANTPTRVVSATATLPSPTGTPTLADTPTLAPTGTPAPSESPTPSQTPVISPALSESIDRRSLGTMIMAVCGVGLLVVAVGQLRKRS